LWWKWQLFSRRFQFESRFEHGYLEFDCEVFFGSLFFEFYRCLEQFGCSEFVLDDQLFGSGCRHSDEGGQFHLLLPFQGQ